MSTHTPGPWNRGVAQNVYQGESWDPKNRQRLIATCEPSTRSQSDWNETWANARLIAAAPDLLTALQDCVMVMERDLAGLHVIQPELEQARAAIAKATGVTC